MAEHESDLQGSATRREGGHDACGVGFIARASGERGNDVLLMALEAVSRVSHRGASGSDASGDGAGVLTQIPRRLLAREASRCRLAVDPDQPFALGSFFLPADPERAAVARELVRSTLEDDGIPFLGWRDVPVDLAALGPAARASCPTIQQAFVGRPAEADDEDAWEVALYLCRREMERRARAAGLLADFYCCSLSCRTVVYKALLTGRQLPAFFLDFHEPDYETAIAVFHQRFSTNTAPTWALAHPFRLLAHNGEINTLWGNRNAMTMRGPMLASHQFGDRIERVREAVVGSGSDSASLDNALELLVRAGRDPLHAALMLVPQAWERYADVDPNVRAFYEYHQCLLEPWDGPAALAFTDGAVVVAAVDRNGLRPCRFKIRRDGLVVAGSEVGLIDLDPREVEESGKVGPGEVLVVDTRRGRVIPNFEAKREVAVRRPYSEWVARHMKTLRPLEGYGEPALPADDRQTLQLAFGYSAEELKYVLEPMAATGADLIWSMGDDAPLAVLSPEPKPLYAFFRQRFAQVTNPPIDPLRESMVMSIRMHLGRRGSPLAESAQYARMLRVEHPVLLEDEMAGLRAQNDFSTTSLAALWKTADGPSGLLPALKELCDQAASEVRKGTRILILSDRHVGPELAPIPMLLALGAVRRHLVLLGLRAQVGIVVEAGDATDIHDLAVLFAYGAEAVYPWMALETVRSLADSSAGAGARVTKGTPGKVTVDADQAARNYRSAAEKGLLKILSKMGISTLASYCGGQNFDCVGLAPEVIDLCFAGTSSPVGGLGFTQLGEDVLSCHRAAFGEASMAPPPLPDYGRVRYRRDTEEHLWSPATVTALQQAVRTGSPEAYATFVARTKDRPPVTLRDLLDFAAAEAIPLVEVEPAQSIARRFVSSAMSLGALSPEAHQALTVAMNRLGARSNSGEGGEDPDLYGRPPESDRLDSKIKQVASGRFGVTAEYLVKAEELEIKIVQGAKPGEGGQLPGHKVTALIARLRHSVPGVTLISPPPHHDIYSIEDLAQLIHDLKTVNPRARVGVKLVAETGVGTVAAGCAKAFADYVLISGHAGGTGASPLSSIKHAGFPWEIGLPEVHKALVENGLRHRVEVRVDGGLRTGRDVVTAALLGAESYGFGTAPLVALGCAMARQCHLNTCPTGVASQREDLRAKFRGSPEGVMRYLLAVAGEVREILASLGVRALDEVIGRSDLLVRRDLPASPLDLTGLLAPALPVGSRRHWVERNERPGLVSLDEEMLRDILPCLETGMPFSGSYPVRNHHLTVGGRVAGVLAERFGREGLPPGRLRFRFHGYAGQSFGAFAVRGMQLDLEGEANDYVGKGLSGGEITIRPFRHAAHAAASHQNQILGNTALYGATSGRLFAAGMAGDRFAVRNSGVVAVVEGCGNHGCEYMTGGVVVVLSHAGRNFGAGMSNGLAYVMDEGGTFRNRLNGDLVTTAPLEEDDERVLRLLVEEHGRRTLSPRAQNVLGAWESYVKLFRKVVPKDEDAPARVSAIRDELLGRVPQVVEATDAVA